MLRWWGIWPVVIGAVACTAMVAVVYAATPITFNDSVPFQEPVIFSQGSGGTTGPATGRGRVNCPTPAATITINTSMGDAGAAINAADAQLGGNTGTIQVSGGGNIATEIVLHSCHTLAFGPGTWTNTVPANTPGACYRCQTILLFDHTTVRGAGMTQTIIMEPADYPSHDNTQSAFVVEPFTEGTGNGPDKGSNDIILQDFQISGIGVRRAANVSQSTINVGFLNGGAVTNVELNHTHSIGLQIGASNCPQTNCTPLYFAQNLTISGCVFIAVGGGGADGQGHNKEGGGGVTLAVINGGNITIQNNKFYDAFGNAVIDIEPNTQNDSVTGLVIDSNLIDQSGAKVGRGYQEFFVYAIVGHAFTTNMSYTVTRNTIIGTYYDAGGGHFFQGGALTEGINTNYVCTGCDARNWDIENNMIKYIAGCGICLYARNSIVKNNTIVMPGDNLLVVGNNNTLQGNLIRDNNTEDAFGYHGIEEQYGSNFNTFSNNQTVGVCGWIDPNPASPTYGKTQIHCNGSTGNPATQPVHRVGANSKSTGNVIIPRPGWPI